MIRRSFVLGAAGLVLLPTQGFAADTVSGRFVCNGKEAKLADLKAKHSGKAEWRRMACCSAVYSEQQLLRYGQVRHCCVYWTCCQFLRLSFLAWGGSATSLKAG